MSKKETKPNLNAVKTDAIDRLGFNEIKHSKVGELIQPGQPETEAMVQDVFQSLYKVSPQLKEEAPLAQRGLVEQLHRLPEYAQAHKMAQLDEISSAFGTLALAPKVLEQLQDIQKKIDEAEEEGEIPEPGEGSGENGEVILEDVLSEEEMSNLRNALRKGVDQAQEAQDEWDTAMRSWGVNPEELKQVPFEKRLELADQILKSGKCKRIADLAGRFKNVVNAANAMVYQHGSDEIVDIGPGSDLERLVPTELMKLKRTPKLFYKDMIEGNLQVYNLKGVEQLGRGPIIIVMDHSGSMAGSRDEWAKAVTLSLMTLAAKQKRAFGFIAFNTEVKFQRFFPRSVSISLEDKIQIAQLGPDGGTDFYRPLKAAFEMRKKDAELKPADIIFITDDEYRFEDHKLKEILNLKEETDVRVFGVAINDRAGGLGSEGKTLEAFSDDIAVVNSLGEIQTLKEIVKKSASGKAEKKNA
jgi:uncharacterized protein with von Willebrand factor type A (vWA) domain